MWLTLRYRRVMAEVRKAYPNKHKVIITECGMTQAVSGRDDIGWRADPAVGEDDYWKSLMWYNDALMRDPYVVSALLFVVGASGGWPKWESFEHLGGIINRLEALQRSAPVEPVTPIEPIKPIVPITPVEPIKPVEPKPLTLQQALMEEAAKRQVIQFNPTAALQQRIFAAGFVPNSPEFEVEYAGVRYVAQRAERLDTGEVRVYYVRSGDWSNVAYHRRETGAELPVV
jgi:hypothetical protein